MQAPLSPQSEPPLAAPPTTRAGRLARRWSNWAANLFVSGIVTLVGLTFGREVIESWRPGPRPSTGTTRDPNSKLDVNANATAHNETNTLETDGDHASVDEIWFNELPVAVGHGGATGSLDDVLLKVVAACERSAERALTERETWERKHGPAELRLLAQLDHATSREERVTPAGAFTVFQRLRPVPLVVVVGEPAAQNANPPLHSKAKSQGHNSANAIDKDNAIDNAESTDNAKSTDNATATDHAHEKPLPEAAGDRERRRVLAWGVILPDAWYTEPEPAGTRNSTSGITSGITTDNTNAIPNNNANTNASAIANNDANVSVPKGRWTWFTWRPHVGDQTATTTDATSGGESGPKVPGGRCVMRIVSVDGSERWAFSGTGSPDAWRAGFERWFAARGWRPLQLAAANVSSNDPAAVRPWRSVGKSRWYGSFATPAPSAESFQAKQAAQATQAASSSPSVPSVPSVPSALSLRRVDAHLIQEASSALRAVLIVYPMASGE